MAKTESRWPAAGLTSPIERVWHGRGTPTPENVNEVCKRPSRFVSDKPRVAASATTQQEDPYSSIRKRLFTTGRAECSLDECLMLCHAEAEWPATGHVAAAPNLLSELARRIPGDWKATEDLAVIALLGADTETTWGLYVRLPLAREGWLQARFADLGKPGSDGLRATRIWGLNADIVEMWVVLDGEADADDVVFLETLTDRLLDELLVGNRPVARWSLSLMAPVCLTEEGQERVSTWDEWRAQSEAKNYLLPQVEHLLGRCGDLSREDCLITREFAPLSALTLYAQHPLYSDEQLQAQITQLRLHDFGGGCGSAKILEWQLVFNTPKEPEEAVFGEDDAPLLKRVWRRYLAEPEEPKPPWSAASLCDFVAATRFVQANYRQEVYLTTEDGGIKLGEVVPGIKPGNGSSVEQLKDMPDLAYWLLEQVGIETAPNARGDDRARVFLSVILEGGMPGDELDGLLARLSTVDPYQSGPIYDGSFAQDEFCQSRYDRFWSLGSLFMCSPHSFAFVGFRQCEELAMKKPRWSFSERLVHALHMPEIYSRLFLLVQFQALALADVGQAISKIGLPGLMANEVDGARVNNAAGQLQNSLTEISDLRSLWVRLRNQRWFLRVSSQVQGEELYDLMQRQTGIGQELDLLNAKLEDLETVISIQTRREAEKNQEAAGRRRRFLELFALPITITLAIRAMLDTGNGLETTSVKNSFDALSTFLCVQNQFAFLISISSFLSFIIIFFIEYKKNYKIKYTNICDKLLSFEGIETVLFFVTILLLSFARDFYFLRYLFSLI